MPVFFLDAAVPDYIEPASYGFWIVIILAAVFIIAAGVVWHEVNKSRKNRKQGDPGENEENKKDRK